MMPDVADGSAHIHMRLSDQSATRALGAALAHIAVPGSVILLDGPLGAGKTTLVQGFASAMGAPAAASPSFVVAHHYPGGKMPVWHLDLYRIDDPAAIDDLDLDQYLPEDGVALIEWAARARHVWPIDRVEVELAIDGIARSAAVQGFGKCAAGVRTLAAMSGS
jgi:tRNA threonylcarbamoyladenosine biosynthesis protein TsaE